MRSPAASLGPTSKWAATSKSWSWPDRPDRPAACRSASPTYLHWPAAVMCSWVSTTGHAVTPAGSGGPQENHSLFDQLREFLDWLQSYFRRRWQTLRSLLLSPSETQPDSNRIQGALQQLRRNFTQVVRVDHADQ